MSYLIADLARRQAEVARQRLAGRGALRVGQVVSVYLIIAAAGGATASLMVGPVAGAGMLVLCVGIAAVSGVIAFVCRSRIRQIHRAVDDAIDLVGAARAQVSVARAADAAPDPLRGLYRDLTDQRGMRRHRRG